MTHYDVLGVASDATAEELHRAYVRLARAHHPDVHETADHVTRERARERMALVNEAWRVLGDPARRRAYDGSIGGPETAAAAEEADDGDVVDAEELLDEWLEGHPTPPVRRADLLVITPVLLVVAAVALGSFALTTGIVALLALAGVCLAVAGVLFVLAPLLAMTKARRHERGAGWEVRR